jgi:hypothetical protein
MSQADGLVERFVANVRSRLNRHRMWTTLVWTVAAAASVLVVAGLWYTLRGYAVPSIVITGVLLAAAVAGIVLWCVRLFSTDGTADVADRHYRLHDAISSYLHFSRAGHSGGYYALQAEHTRRRVEPLDPQDIKYQPPRRGIALAACLVAIAVPLSLRGPSQEILIQEQLAAQTQEATAVINEALAKTIEQLREESADPNEKELLEPNKLCKWVDELQQTADHKEALRQYAELERKLNEARLAMQDKRDEQLLQRAARELENTQETKSLAAELKQRNYDRAAEELNRISPQQATQPIDKQRQELARLKAAAQHMAAAARSSRSAAQNAKASASAKPSASKSARSNSQSGENSSDASGEQGAADENGGELAQVMEELEETVAEFDDSLSEALRQEQQEGECSSEQAGKCQACQQSVAQQLAKMNSKLKKLGMCQRCDSRLAKLCSMCSQCQGGLCQAAALCQSQSPNAGGKEAGMGSNTARRNQIDELVDNGQTTQLKGIKGTGPSLTTVEAASDGSGVSSRQAASRQREFRRQFESFVAREDIPEQVKDGVKHYFEVIHQIEPPTNSEEAPANDASGD